MSSKAVTLPILPRPGTGRGSSRPQKLTSSIHYRGTGDRSAQDEAKAGVVLVPHREIGAPDVVVEVEVHAPAQRRLAVREVQQGGLARRNQRRVQRLDGQSWRDASGPTPGTLPGNAHAHGVQPAIAVAHH